MSIFNVLFLDIETTTELEFKKNKNYNWWSTPEKYPCIGELSFIQATYIEEPDSNWKIVNKIDTQLYVLPYRKDKGEYEIDKVAQSINHITKEMLEEKGKDLLIVLSVLNEQAKLADIIVSHDAHSYFDIPILLANAEIVGVNNVDGSYGGNKGVMYKHLKKEKRFSTMTEPGIMEYMGLRVEGRKGYKWPKLTEMYEKLFKKELIDAHTALADVNATFDCFNELIKLKVFDLNKILK